MPIAVKAGLNAAEFCSELELIIQNMGAKAAFGVGDIVVAYSGPSSEVRKSIKTTFTGNWKRSSDQADRLGGRRIDDTLIGNFLASFDFDDYFRGAYPTDISAREQAEFDVWATASTLFMRARFKELATAVCAADPERVFRKYEISSVLKNRRVHVINNRPAQLFKDFQKISPDEAYRLFCLTELLEARKHAQKINTTDAWNDYRERRCFHFLQCQYELGRTSALPAAVKQKQKLQKAQALLAHKMAAALRAPAKPTVSRAKKAGMGRAP